MKLGVDTNSIQDKSRSGMADGDHIVMVSSVVARGTKDNLGEELNIEMTDNQTNSKVWDSLVYMHNSNQTRVDIGLSRWKQICTALGLSGDVDTDQVAGKQLKITLKTKGDYQNVVNYAAATPAASPQGIQSQPMFQQPQSPVAGYATTQPQAAPSGGEIQSQDIPF